MNKADATVTIERIAYTVEEAAAALGVAEDRVRQEVRLGRIPHVVLGQERILIGRQALEAWLTQECLANLTRPAHVSSEELAQLPVRTGQALRKFRIGSADRRPGGFAG